MSWQLAGGSVVSRDGRYAYYITYKDIGPYQTMGRSWHSRNFIGRFDILTGQFDSWPIPAGKTQLGGSGLLMTETVAQEMRKSGIFGRHNEQASNHGYGDGRYCYLSTRTDYSTDTYLAFLIDNARDSYRQFDKNVREGYISTDERYVVYWKRDSVDTWLFDIVAGRKRKIIPSEAIPPFLSHHRQLQEPVGHIGRWHEFIQKYTKTRLYPFYPQQEEIK